MAYEKTVWKDQQVENPRTYSVRQNLDNTITLYDAFGEITEIGTPVNAENMNKIEQGIANAQLTSNLEQSLSQSTTKYPSSKAVQDAVNSKVSKTGNETIYGYKTFRNDNSAASVFIQGYLGLSENPAISGGQAQLEFHDKNGEWEGIVGVERYTNGQRLLKFQLKDQDGAQNRIELVRDQNGVWYATCPTPSSVSDNSTKIATTAWVHSFFNLVYPVGSIYLSTAGTCPLQSLGIGTWNKVGTSLTLNVNTNVPVKGTGQALGFLGDSNSTRYLLSGQVFPGVDRQGLLTVSSSNGAVGKTGNESVYAGNALVGISTDSSKSGIVGTLTRTQITVNVFQRTA